VRRYETILVLRSDLPETQLKDTLRRFEGVLTAGGAHVLATEDWGVREMAYKIRREQRAQYFRLDYVASAAAVNELERNLKLSDVVLRYLSVVTDVRPDLSKLKEQTSASAQSQALAPQTTGESVATVGEDKAQATDAQAEQVEPSMAAESGVEQN
jgi:small subunit ribosomal protein S6